ncbi:right-handed parallel beta-helix repeat-containing protein [Reichenbachiella agarivorans]|uniref:Right-handed parallel beta-helix repeat-containing protein n=1 Tax=Reichenbachiella agarivorans TaxID=2979464 RepID=A0ABY6CM30_9BACT|nr:chondroitinase-B domain-containing protein [Reichenbachiella agarivorans]UXP31561.1 right-handed parallel beta-helix repeat-containing protein [Reichenbachiella agarivorans]
MKTLNRTLAIMLVSILTAWPTFAQSNKRFVTSQAEFDAALNASVAGDSIVWKSGIYSHVSMDIDKDGVIVTAEVSGEVSMTGASRVEIPADGVTLSGIQFLSGDIKTAHVIVIDGSDVLVTEINIKDYTSYKYLIIDELSQRVTVSHCNFENRLNLDDQNILSILVDATQPGYHTIQFCSFKNFAGSGGDMGIEPIRIGVSTQSKFISRSVVEYCYFTACDGDGEIISNKAAQNVFRYNTFENNTKAELVLRHGNQGMVYGNFFLHNMGGIRVREGQNHFIYNNYFEGNTRRSILLQNESSDPLDYIHIYFNTFVNSAQVELGNTGGSNAPKNVVLANNLFAQPTDKLFAVATGNETWIGNISDGTLGIDPVTGLSAMNPLLEENEFDFLQLGTISPAIDAGQAGFPTIPTFEGLDIDSELLLDMMKQPRPSAITQKDVGASEYSQDGVLRPHATAGNTGPSYLSDQRFYALSIEVIGSGTIQLDPPSGLYTEGTTVTVKAIPSEGATFTNWTGGISGSDNPQSLVIDQDTKITANFTEVPEVLDTQMRMGNHTISLYPNPTHDKLKLEINASSRTRIQIEVLGFTGQKSGLQWDKYLEPGQHIWELDISNLATGMYFVNLKQYDLHNHVMDSSRVKIIKK